MTAIYYTWYLMNMCIYCPKAAAQIWCPESNWRWTKEVCVYFCAVQCSTVLDVNKVQATSFLLRGSIRHTTSSDLQEPLHQLHGVPEIADPVVYSWWIGLH